MKNGNAEARAAARATHRKNIRKLLVLTLLLGLTFLAANVYGAAEVAPRDIFNILFRNQDSGMYTVIIRQVRFPRNILACMVGASLSLAGAIMQGMMRNPMASPSVLGVTTGASTATYLMYIFFPASLSLVPMGAFAGALVTTFLIFVFAWKGGLNPTRFILSGVALSSVLTAVNNILIIRYPNVLEGLSGFMVGGLSARSWPQVRMVTPYFLAGTVLALLYANKLNVIMMGDELATSLGVDVDRVRMALIAISSLLAASAVSVAGLISFVGLCVPHIMRLYIGSDYRYLMPASALGGALILTLCDTVGRVILRPSEIPVGIIMALLGAPFFLWMLRRKEV
ncbi:MAG: iron ABC transporter permease [Clostridiales bacterium]|nr:iron ABC transporter permease [Clostridiales bacterium]